MEAVHGFDMSTFRLIHVDLHRAWLDPVFWVLSSSGLGWVQFLLTLILLKWQETRAYVAPVLITIVVSGVLYADVLKLIVTRDRPSNLAFARPQESIYGTSFPSGHSSTAFGIATMLVLLTWPTKHRLYGLLSIPWAVLVGVSRVYRGVHWPTDVLAGLFGGVFSACLVFLVRERLAARSPQRPAK